jgi:hypothetical protein
VRLFDRFVDFDRKAEIVGRDDEPALRRGPHAGGATG